MIATASAFGLLFDYPAGDLAVGRCLRDYGEFGAVGVALAREITGGGAFVDIGANIGAMALPVALVARTVVAVEAHAGLASLLLQNAARNNLANVEVVAAAAGAAPGEIDFPTPDLSESRNFGATSLARLDAPLRRLPMVTVDDIAPPDVRLIKIDVEGYEPEVLAGATRTLRAGRAAWIVEAERDCQASRATISLLEAEGYTLWWLYIPFVTPHAPRRGPPDRVRGDVNILALPAGYPAPRGLPAVDLALPWPSSVDEFPYLARFGFSIRPRQA